MVARPDGRFDVSFTVEAKKFHADGKGRETEAPLDEPFDIGVFTAEPGRPGYSAASVLLMQRQPIPQRHAAHQRHRDHRPTHVGVD